MTAEKMGVQLLIINYTEEACTYFEMVLSIILCYANLIITVHEHNVTSVCIQYKCMSAISNAVNIHNTRVPLS